MRWTAIGLVLLGLVAAAPLFAASSTPPERLAAPTLVPVALVGVGYAPVSSQPGGDIAQKRLMAVRASRMAAMRDLAEQLHGLRIEGSTVTTAARVQDDSFRTSVRGLVVGARTVKIGPKGSDSYETVLELDPRAVQASLAAMR
jgi:hypothetical protein